MTKASLLVVSVAVLGSLGTFPIKPRSFDTIVELTEKIVTTTQGLHSKMTPREWFTDSAMRSLKRGVLYGIVCGTNSSV